MTISYPLSIPNVLNSRNIQWGYETSVGMTNSPFTRKTQIVDYSGDMWVVDFDLPLANDDDGSEWIAFLMALRGTRGTFLLGHPLKTSPRGTGAGTPLVNGASQTGNTLITDGWGASQTVLKKGDFFALGQRLYSVTQDAVTNGSGQVTLDIFPNLRESPANNDPLDLTSPKGLFRLAENEVLLTNIDVTRLNKIQFRAIEAL